MKGLRILFIFFMLIMILGPVYSQHTTVNPWKFHSINSIGLLDGENNTAFQLQTVNGAQYKSWFAGLGLGLDYYRYRTIPLFIDLRKEFGRNRNKVFVYTDVGISFSWVKNDQKTIYVEDDRFGNGLYSDLGLGYKRAIGKSNALLMTLGYSFKKVTESYSSPIYYYSFRDPDMNGQNETIQYSLNRLSIKIGWVF